MPQGIAVEGCEHNDTAQLVIATSAGGKHCEPAAIVAATESKLHPSHSQRQGKEMRTVHILNGSIFREYKSFCIY